jgi:BirA family transcriptional regulator, biotin operon repressor / biotin---[acetyl-CoA-carboxylase] ligase
METLFTGKRIIFLPRVTSTNSYATELLKNVNLPEGTVIHTAHQTEGKGQRGNSWVAEPDCNLTASVILKPAFLDISNNYFLTIISALAVHDTLSGILAGSQFDIRIKWPNDVLVNKEKIAGILTENNITGNQINWTVAGFGININQTTFPIKKVTSLKLLTGSTFEIETILTALCSHLEKHYLRLMNDKYAEVRAEYLKYFYGLNEVLPFEKDGVISQLRVEGLTDSGQLLLSDESGNAVTAGIKEYRWI